MPNPPAPEQLVHENGWYNPETALDCLQDIDPIMHSQGALETRGRTSVREGLTRGDYDFFRPAEAIPKDQQSIVSACDEAYKRIGPLRNVIDLMSDFASQGIDIFHPNKTKQNRYRCWFRKVNGKERSERFLNLLYRQGSVIIKRAYADLNLGDIEDLERGIAGRPPDEPEDVPYKRGPKIYKNRIPIQYTYLNPNSIEMLGGDLALFAGEPRYALKIPDSLARLIKNPKTEEERRLVASLPAYVTDPIRRGKKLIPLDPNKIIVYHYKKDDWQQWALPMTYSILADLRLLEKMKLADMSALDGAVSHVRLWRLGIPELKIQPGPGAFARLRDQLLMAQGGGAMDLIWDKTLDLQESSTDVYRFLGMQKYEPVMKAIYAGLGIPQSLTGGESKGGMTNNSMSLKTLIERLQYGRDQLEKFWENELTLIQEAFGDRTPAQIHFDHMSISDEANEKMLWMHLVDRDIISVESMREKFGQIPDVEEARIKREYNSRMERLMPPKVSPYHEAQPDLAKQKIALQTGVVSPEQVDTPLEPGGGDRLFDIQKQQLDLQKKQVNNQMKLAQSPPNSSPPGGNKGGTPGQGRPPNSKDSQKRKQKAVTPRTSGEFLDVHTWAKKAQVKISNILSPHYLLRCKKDNKRKLTASECNEFERIKFDILCSLSPGDEVTEENITEMMDDPPAPMSSAQAMVGEWERSCGGDYSLEDLRDTHTLIYSLLNSGGGDGE